MATVTVRPTADGTYKQFPVIYPTTPSTHYDKVDEVTPNDATDYIGSNAGDGAAHDFYDTFKKAATGIPSGSTINSVTVYTRGRVIPTPAGSKVTWAEAIYTYGKLYDGATHNYTSWTTTSTTWTTNPYTGAPWTVDEVEALEIGVKGLDRYDTAGDESWAQVSTVWAVIDYTPPVAAKRIMGDGFVWVMC